MEASIKYSSSTTLGFTVERILRFVEPVLPETPVETLSTLFSADHSLRAIPVVKNSCPVGLIQRFQLADKFAQPQHVELLDKRHCSDLMNAQPLLVEKSTPIDEVSQFLSQTDMQQFVDSFIITEQGRYIGLGTSQDLLREITHSHISTSRHAHPLSKLPGSVPTNEHIEHLLQSGLSFAVCYADLDHLKPFNDKYGYHKGDELIQFTSKLLSQICDPTQDFIGHIGGDDFIFILQSKDWEQRCHRALAAFAQTSSGLFDKQHRAMGGYKIEDRQSRIVHHPLPTLSIGVVWVTPKLFDSHYEIVEAVTTAKILAKKKPGNSLFIERRHPNSYKVSETQRQNAEVFYG
ncbi:MAG: GGDEF domain-containing protein [Gallionella sp.]|nr:GGDEF domain-containing protein [Gallionella sp.]